MSGFQYSTTNIGLFVSIHIAEIIQKKTQLMRRGSFIPKHARLKEIFDLHYTTDNCMLLMSNMIDFDTVIQQIGWLNGCDDSSGADLITGCFSPNSRPRSTMNFPC